MQHPLNSSYRPNAGQIGWLQHCRCIMDNFCLSQSIGSRFSHGEHSNLISFIPVFDVKLISFVLTQKQWLIAIVKVIGLFSFECVSTTETEWFEEQICTCANKQQRDNLRRSERVHQTNSEVHMLCSPGTITVVPGRIDDNLPWPELNVRAGRCENWMRRRSWLNDIVSG